MYKLLPPTAQEKVKREYLLRRAVTMVAALVLVEIVTLVGLFPSYVLSEARQEEAREKAALARDSGGVSTQGLRAWIDALNLKLKTLNPKSDTDRPSEDFFRILEQKGAGVRLTGFRWLKANGQTELSVSGVARDRQSLLAWESSLKNSGDFTNVALPVSNLAKDKDIGFEFKLVATPQ